MQFNKYKCIAPNPAWQSEDEAAARAIGSSSDAIAPATTSTAGLSTITLPLETPLRSSNNSNYANNNNYSNNYNNNNSADLASVDSSDTYASCQTHLFPSAGDEFAGISCDLDDLDMDNFASNPFEAENNNCDEASSARVKRSASGDGLMHSLGVMPSKGQASFQSLDSAAVMQESSMEANEMQLPKHRKTRFQAGSLSILKGRSTDSGTPPKKASDDSLTEPMAACSSSSGASATLPSSSKKNRRASFMPSKSLASATKLINQHLFGIQNNVPRTKGTCEYCQCDEILFRLFVLCILAKTENLSQSQDSIDSAAGYEHHRRSKSILKNKAESSKGQDPESERLLADNLSGAGISETGSVSTFVDSVQSIIRTTHSVL